MKLDRSVIASCALFVASAALPPSVPAQTVAAEATAAAATQSKVRVLVALKHDAKRGTRYAARVAAARRAQDELLGGVSGRESRLLRRFAAVPAVSLEVTAAGLEELRSSAAVERVDLDLPGRGALAESVPQIGGDVVRALAGLTGSGVSVAVLDSGVESDHPDLRDAVVAEQCFCSGGDGCCPNGEPTQSGPGAARDDHGHGTHVSGIITSAGVTAPLGTAPKASIVAVKVLDSKNEFCCASDVIAALDWVLTARPDVKVVNMSLCTYATFAGDCDDANAFTRAMADAIDSLTANGVTVFASSCNDALGDALAAPACIASAVSVGAVTKTDLVPRFSNSASNLDLLAPGVAIFSTMVGGRVSSISGTSMAAPHAAGAAALLLQARPRLRPATVLSALQSTGVLLSDPKNGLVFPRIDADAALEAFGCGDGVVTGAEECDDGNGMGGDGCSTECTVEACHVCTGSPSGCALAPPRNACHTAGRSSLLLKDTSPDGRDRLVWKWMKGEETAFAELGGAADGFDYFDLCVYEDDGLVFGSRILKGGVCAKGRPCWRRRGRASAPRGVTYADVGRWADGIQKVVLENGSAGRAKAIVLGQGERLPFPGARAGDHYVDPQSEILVQLGDAGGACWESRYAGAQIQRNMTRKLRAQSR